MAAPGGSSTLRWITRANALGKCARRHLEPRQSPVGMKWCSAPEKYLALSVPGHAETESTTPIRRCTRVIYCQTTTDRRRLWTKPEPR